MRYTSGLLLLLSVISCNYSRNDAIPSNNSDSGIARADTAKAVYTNNVYVPACQNVPNSERCDLVDFAETFIGTPYKYGSTDPSVGFDCSCFIYYVFSHFNIKVPRSSVEYTDLGTEVSM